LNAFPFNLVSFLHLNDCLAKAFEFNVIQCANGLTRALQLTSAVKGFSDLHQNIHVVFSFVAFNAGKRSIVSQAFLVVIVIIGIVGNASVKGDSIENIHNCHGRGRTLFAVESVLLVKRAG
jgi:hypothetical protein